VSGRRDHAGVSRLLAHAVPSYHGLEGAPAKETQSEPPAHGPVRAIWGYAAAEQP
jgi:hypothetical protein